MFAKFRTIGIVVLLAVLGGFACKKKSNQVSTVPNQTVNITLYPNDPQYYKIQTVGGWIYFNGGVNGIIIYRKTMTDFVALERTSSYYPDNVGAIAKVQSDNFTCKDTVSGSKWQIIDGTVMTGPASYPLRVYQTVYDGNSLRILN